MNIKSIVFLLVAGMLLVSCKKDFLERYPQSEISPQVFFTNEKDLELYTNSFYAYLPSSDIFQDDISSDNIDMSGIDERVTGTRRVSSDAGAAGWSWSQLYNINYFLGNYDKPEISEEVKGHYGGMARFFRAFFYFEKVKRFGDVPWYGKTLDLGTSDLYKARDSRALVMDSIIADLDFAINNMRSAKTVGRINKWTALALKSRVCLFEGTFRKYHTELNLQGSANQLLQEAANAADILMKTGPYKLSTGNVNTVYLDLFSSNIPNNDEFILARLYGIDVSRTHIATELFTSATRGNPGITKSLINSYLLSNGMPFSSLPNYATLTFWEEVKNRDPRLSQTIRTPGYRRIGADPSTPALNPDYASTYTGYQNIKFVSTPNGGGVNPLPILRFAEVLLNYAEAMAEMNKLTQSEADRSINHLRARVNVPKLILTGLTADPMLLNQYKHTSDPIVLEVRRERRVELAMEGFRYYDLMRWKEGRLLTETFYGAYFPSKGVFDLDQNGINDIGILDSSPPSPISGVQYFVLAPDKALSEGSKGNIVVHPNLVKKFDETKDYYFPLPINELILNPQLTQNPGWPKR